MNKLNLHWIAAACALTFTTLARADDVDFTGYAHGYETVSYSLSAPNAVHSGSAGAGGFATTLNGGASFVSYCVDLYQTINFSDPAYTDYSVPGTSHVFANSNAYSDLGKLYARAGVVDSSVEEAAFQIAVWEIAYETFQGPYSLSTGSALFSGGSAASSGALSLAANWLSSLGSSNGPSISVLESPGHQDVIMAPVPEPSTVLLMMLGLAGIGSNVMRRKARASRPTAA